MDLQIFGNVGAIVLFNFGGKYLGIVTAGQSRWRVANSQ